MDEEKSKRHTSASRGERELAESINGLRDLLTPLLTQAGPLLAQAGPLIRRRLRSVSGVGASGTLRELPHYNNTLGDFLKFPDDLQQTYSDVLMQVYPLQADLEKLQRFCDSYFVPD